MTMQRFLKDSKFFFTTYHTGKINIIFHIVSIIVLLIGLISQNIILSIMGLAVIDELGHIYNYFFLHKRDLLFNPVRMLPYQILYVIPPALIIFKLFSLI